MKRFAATLVSVPWGLASLACLLPLGVSGCREDSNSNGEMVVIASVKKPVAPPASASAAAAASGAASAWPVPVGPSLAVLPGKGVGSIRFGANAATIERLMELPCEIKTESLCGYNGRAVDFVLTNGAVTEIRVHRVDRADPNLAGAKYGVFNGRLLEGVSPGMLQPAAVQALGAAQRVEQVKDGGAWGTVERHHYADMTIEYDRLENGNVVLGGIVLKGTAAAGAASAAPGAAPAPAAPAGSGKAK